MISKYFSAMGILKSFQLTVFSVIGILHDKLVFGRPAGKLSSVDHQGTILIQHPFVQPQGILYQILRGGLVMYVFSMLEAEL
jgi:hypothetical protein